MCFLKSGGTIATDGNNTENSNDEPNNADASSFDLPPSISDDNSDYIDIKKHCLKRSLVLNLRQILSSPKGNKYMDYKMIKIIDITHKLNKQMVFLMNYNFCGVRWKINKI